MISYNWWFFGILAVGAFNYWLGRRDGRREALRDRYPSAWTCPSCKRDGVDFTVSSSDEDVTRRLSSRHMADSHGLYEN